MSSDERENSINPMPKGCHRGRTTDRRVKWAGVRRGARVPTHRGHPMPIPRARRNATQCVVTGSQPLRGTDNSTGAGARLPYCVAYVGNTGYVRSMYQMTGFRRLSSHGGFGCVGRSRHGAETDEVRRVYGRTRCGVVSQAEAAEILSAPSGLAGSLCRRVRLDRVSASRAGGRSGAELFDTPTRSYGPIPRAGRAVRSPA